MDNCLSKNYQNYREITSTAAILKGSHTVSLVCFGLFLDSISFNLFLLLIVIMTASLNIIIQFIVRIVLAGAANGRIRPKEAIHFCVLH